MKHNHQYNIHSFKKYAISLVLLFATHHSAIAGGTGSLYNTTYEGYVISVESKVGFLCNRAKLLINNKKVDEVKYCLPSNNTLRTKITVNGKETIIVAIVSQGVFTTNVTLEINGKQYQFDQKY